MSRTNKGVSPGPRPVHDPANGGNRCILSRPNSRSNFESLIRKRKYPLSLLTTRSKMLISAIARPSHEAIATRLQAVAQLPPFVVLDVVEHQFVAAVRARDYVTAIRRPSGSEDPPRAGQFGNLVGFEVEQLDECLVGADRLIVPES